ncbi:MAG: NADH-quinone oxidoreductase subunit H [Candidatus Omnitrophica bacterium]|nr:NADH-quinone oxidoreductase subunit H [Candidatus Omnitrophota bacterium]
MNILNVVLLSIVWSIFLIAAGLLILGVERKITARLQWRVGPPWWQNFTDIIKLSAKETSIPERANRFIFIFAPIVSFLGALAAGVIIIFSLLYGISFRGDLITVIFLLTLPYSGLILGGSSSGNALASVGSSRALKLTLACELPFIASLVLIILKSNLSTSIYNIVNMQKNTGINFFSVSGFIAFFVAFWGSIGKLGIVPFDLAEADTEIAGGALFEYSGILLGFFKLTKAVLFIVVPLLLIASFFGSFNVLAWILEYLVIFLLLIIVKNTNPRLRIDQSLRFFWKVIIILIIASFVFMKI